MATNTISVSGNAAGDAQVFNPGQGARTVASFRLIHTPRVRDGQGGWSDGTPVGWDVVAYGQLAENVAKSIKQGIPVTVTGSVQDNSFEREGQTVHRVQIVAQDVSVPLTFGTVTYERTGPRAARDGVG
jgi:single-strand DNA-binding protein